MDFIKVSKDDDNSNPAVTIKNIATDEKEAKILKDEKEDEILKDEVPVDPTDPIEPINPDDLEGKSSYIDPNIFISTQDYYPVTGRQGRAQNKSSTSTPSGIFPHFGQEFKVEKTSSNRIKIYSGLIQIDGCVIEMVDNKELTFNFDGLFNVCLEVDLDVDHEDKDIDGNERIGNARIVAFSGKPQQDDLTENPDGLYQYPLCEVRVIGTGIDYLNDKSQMLQNDTGRVMSLADIKYDDKLMTGKGRDFIMYSIHEKVTQHFNGRTHIPFILNDFFQPGHYENIGKSFVESNELSVPYGSIIYFSNGIETAPNHLMIHENNTQRLTTFACDNYGNLPPSKNGDFVKRPCGTDYPGWTIELRPTSWEDLGIGGKFYLYKYKTSDFRQLIIEFVQLDGSVTSVWAETATIGDKIHATGSRMRSDNVTLETYHIDLIDDGETGTGRNLKVDKCKQLNLNYSTGRTSQSNARIRGVYAYCAYRMYSDF